MSLSQARKAHAAALAQTAQARRGDAADPASERDAQRAQARLGDNVADFAAIYLDLHARPTKRSWAEDERILKRDVLPFVGTLKLKDLTQSNVQAVLDRIDRRGARNQAWHNR